MYEDAAFFLVQDSAAALSTRMSDLGRCGCFMIGSLITSIAALHKNVIVTCSRLLILIRSEDLFLRYFRVLSLMSRAQATQCYKLSSGQHTPHLVKHTSPVTVQSQSAGIIFMIGISYRKAVGDVAMLERRFISARIVLVTLNFSFDFHTVLWDFLSKSFLC